MPMTALSAIHKPSADTGTDHIITIDIAELLMQDDAILRLLPQSYLSLKDKNPRLFMQKARRHLLSKVALQRAEFSDDRRAACLEVMVSSRPLNEPLVFKIKEFGDSQTGHHEYDPKTGMLLIQAERVSVSEYYTLHDGLWNVLKLRPPKPQAHGAAARSHFDLYTFVIPKEGAVLDKTSVVAMHQQQAAANQRGFSLLDGRGIGFEAVLSCKTSHKGLSSAA